MRPVMGETIFHDLYRLSQTISKYLPLSEGIALNEDVSSLPQTITLTSKVKEGEHWAVVAKTGNGKTTLDKHLINAYFQKYPYINLYIVDSKKLGDFSERDGKVYRTYEPPPLLKGIGQKQVWQPVIDDIDSYDQFFRNILDAGKPALVLIDESKNLKFGQKAPKGYELILAQGRKPGISTITNYQEVANGLRQGLSQPTHIICGHVWNNYDERIMKQYMRVPEPGSLPLSGKYSFLYINRDRMAKPLLFRDYKDFIPYILKHI
jgi:energy-coupling factor transporter ATP-binding protein EcfA2